MRAQLRKLVRSVPAFTADAALAVALALAAELEVLASTAFPGSRAAAAALIPAITLPLAWRRRAPVASFAVVYGAYAAQALAGGHAEQSIAVSIALLVSIYSVAVHAADDRVALLALIPGQAVAWLALSMEGGRGAGDYVFSVLLGGGAWLGGYAVRSGRVTASQLELRAARAEAQSAEERERAVAEERARIAREMHDVLAHTISVVVVQAGAARQILRSRPQQSEEMLRSVEETSRQALTEMRRLLGLVRGEAGEHGIEPQPGLAQLEELVARAREAGLELGLAREGKARPLPAGVDLAAYRIAQEAVTNAIRYGASPASLAIRYLPGAIEIELCNAIADRPPTPSGAGHGLIGMRERAHLYGGKLEAGPAAGRFRVLARLPVDGWHE